MLYKNANSNNVPDVRIIEKKEIQKLEKNVDSDLALYVGSTGIVSAHDLMTAFYKYSQSMNHDYLFKSEVSKTTLEPIAAAPSSNSTTPPDMPT